MHRKGTMLLAVIMLATSIWAVTPGQTKTLTQSKPGLRIEKLKAAVSPPAFSGTCPATFAFTGTIAAQGAGIVQYRWVRSDGAKGPVKSLLFKGSGIRTVKSEWTLGTTGQHIKGWQVLRVISPERKESNRAEFKLTCVHRFAMPTYRISGTVSGGAEGHLLYSRKALVILSKEGRSLFRRTLTLNRSGNADFTFGGPWLGPGTYRLRIEKVPSNPDELAVTANICWDHAEPESRVVTLTRDHRNADNEDFRIFFTIAFDHRGICW